MTRSRHNVTRPDFKGDGGTVGRNRRSSHETNVRSVGILIEALDRIAAPRRPDGTFNLSREACRDIAVDALCAWEDAQDAEIGA